MGRLSQFPWVTPSAQFRCLRHAVIYVLSYTHWTCFELTRIHGKALRRSIGASLQPLRAGRVLAPAGNITRLLLFEPRKRWHSTQAAHGGN